MTGYPDGPTFERVEQRDVTGTVMGAAGSRRVVRCANADQYCADLLVSEVELDLFPGSLDQERRIGVCDRAQAGHCHSAGNADHELFPDADVDRAVRLA